MLSSTRNSLDALKRQALMAVMSNVEINYPYLKEDLYKYISASDGGFTSLLDRFSFDPGVMSSSQINGSWLLSYLDFYTLYTILFANGTVFESLKAASTNKFMYIESMYKELNTIKNTKALQKVNKQALYIDFCNPKGIDLKNSGMYSRYNKVIPVLGYKDAITLPIENTRRISPHSIICTDNDITVHSTMNAQLRSDVQYNILRRQSKKVGVVSRVSAGSRSVSYALAPAITGTLWGYYTDRIYVEYSDGNIRGSSDNRTWSSNTPITIDEACKIRIEDDIDTGLEITLVDGEGLRDGDSWIVTIQYVNIEDPTLTMRIKFGVLEQMSYIRYSDISRYPLEFKPGKIKHRKYDSYVDVGYTHNMFAASISPVCSQVDELKLEAMQHDAYSDISADDAVYNYEFNINRIEGVINTYKPTGSITLEPITTEACYNIALDTVSWEPTGLISKSFIEHSVQLEIEGGRKNIPILRSVDGGTINEFIIPSKILENNYCQFTTRFPLDDQQSILIYNSTKELEPPVNIDPESIELNPDGTANITVQDYNNKNSYYIRYSVKLHNFDDIADATTGNGAWISSDNIYYMHTVGYDGRYQLAVRMSNGTSLLQPLSGSIIPVCEMRSVDKPYVSPMIFEYKMLIN